MKLKEAVAFIFIGIISTVIAGYFLLRYEYKNLKGKEEKDLVKAKPHKSFNKNSTSKKNGKVMNITIKRIVKIIPNKSFSSRISLLSKIYNFKNFEIQLKGQDEGFGEKTLVQITTLKGMVVAINIPEALKPRFGNGELAINWKNLKSEARTRSLFIDGPGKNLEASLVVLIKSKDEIPDDSIKLLINTNGENITDTK